MASLIKRSNGIWYGVFSYKGKRVWRSTRSHDKEEAIAVFNLLSKEYVSWKKLTLTDFKMDLCEMLKATLTPSTVNLYEQAFTTFINVVGNRTLASVTPYHVERYKAKRMQTVSATKVNIDFRTLRAAFTRAVAFGMIETNPFRACRNVILPDRRPVFLSGPEFAMLLKVIDDKQMRLMVAIAVCTAMRLGELISLRWDAVDFNNRRIILTNRSNFMLKNKKQRDVPMNDNALRALEELPRKSEYVFTGLDGNRLCGRSVSRKFKKYVLRAGLSEEIHFHSLRHTGATWMVNANVPLLYVKEILGHSSITTTMMYSHTSLLHLQGSVRAIDRMFSN